MGTVRLWLGRFYGDRALHLLFGSIFSVQGMGSFCVDSGPIAIFV